MNNISDYVNTIVNICNLYIQDSLIDYNNDRLEFVEEDGFITYFYFSRIISAVRIENAVTEILKIFAHISSSISHKRNPDIDIENYVYEWVN